MHVEKDPKMEAFGEPKRNKIGDKNDDENEVEKRSS